MRAGLATDVHKTTVGDYVVCANGLLASMSEVGFLPNFAVPVDPSGELLGGSHRVACALALGIEEIPVVNMPGKVWAPSWGRDWFLSNGLDEGTIAALEASLTR